MAELIQHSGVVESIENQLIHVKITSESACGTCKAREACGLSESKDKIVEIRTLEALNYVVGESVTVSINRRAGSYAVFFAYILALGVLMVLLVIGIKALGWSEGQSAFLSMVGVVAYFCTLWLFRAKLEDKIKITITKK